MHFLRHNCFHVNNINRTVFNDIKKKLVATKKQTSRKLTSVCTDLRPLLDLQNKLEKI